MTIINSQLGGKTPTGTKSITSNGLHDVAAYEYADVDVPTTAPAYYIEKTKDANNVLQNGSTLMNFSGLSSIGDRALEFSYYGNTNITGNVDLSSLTTMSGSYNCDQAFTGCTGITSVDFSSLETLFGFYNLSSMFYNCTGITSVDLSSLTTIGDGVSGNSQCNSMFRGCTGITSVNLSSLKQIYTINACSSMFSGCTGITSVDLSSLTTIAANNACQQMFYGCTGITGSVDLSSLTTITGNGVCSSMFSGCTGITSVNLSSLILASAQKSLQSMFNGCTNLTTVDISHLCKLGTNNQLSQTFRNCTSLTTLSFPNLAYITTNINAAFDNTLQGVTGCTVHFPSDWQTDMASYSNIINGLGGTNTTVLFDLPAVTTLDLSKVIDIDTGVFNSFDNSNYFPNINSVDLSSLTTISGNGSFTYAFYNCTGITSVDLSSLTTVNSTQACSNMFQGCTGLTSVTFSSLETILGSSAFYYCFGFCTSLTTLSFPALKTVVNNGVFSNMLAGVTGCTVHFPSNLSGYNFGVGGSNTVLYDLPPTA